MNKIIQTIYIFGMLASSAAVNALVISDLDLNNQSFEVDNLDSNVSATGSSNGISFSLASAGFYMPFSNTTGSQSYNDLPGGYDDLHLGADFSITFDQSIDYLLVALANDNNTGTGLNFNLVPSDYKDASIAGTQISITDIGGALVLYEFSSPITSISHINNDGINDGFDVSFFAGITPGSGGSIPEPSIFWLIGSGILGLLVTRKKVHR